MAHGMLRRAGVAVVLIAMLALPYGTCQPTLRGDGHDCCVHPVPAVSLKTSCCIVRAELPAIVSQRAALSVHPLAMVAFAGTAAGPAIRFAAGPQTPIAHHSPPPGASILRI